jgi:subfamily B ATP-binding cassette protein MsbA
MKIWTFIKPYKFRALLAMLITIPIGALDAVLAAALKPFMDNILLDQSQDKTMYIPLFIIFFALIQSVFNFFATYLNSWVGLRVTFDLKQKLFNTLMTYNTKFFDTTSSGDVIFRFNNDAELACSGLLKHLKVFFTRVVSSISLIAVLFYNSWQLALVAIIVLFGAMLPLASFRYKVSELMHQSLAQAGKLITQFNEVFTGNKIVHSYNLNGYLDNIFSLTAKDLFKVSIKIVKKAAILAPVMNFVMYIGIALIIWYGSYLIVNDIITPGSFVSFLTALIMLYNPLKNIGGSYSQLQLSLMAIERVFDLINADIDIKEDKNAKVLSNVKGDISFNNVTFGYNGETLFNNLNLNIKAGQSVALVGNSGGGKSTIVSLIARFYDVNSGSITIDGNNLTEVSLKSLRDNISFVFQDNFLFHTTIRDNIALGDESITDDDIYKALESACLLDFVNEQEHGIYTSVGERGSLLSGGQKQRLSIARALVRKTPIVVLDEATSALDNKSEKIVQKAIANLMNEKTVIIVAHRLSTIKNADNIVVIRDGLIVEQGNHDTLINQNGYYMNLYNSST